MPAMPGMMPGAGMMPPAVDGDDSLPALLMAWYYAGYHTGRHAAKAEMQATQYAAAAAASGGGRAHAAQ